MGRAARILGAAAPGAVLGGGYGALTGSAVTGNRRKGEGAVSYAKRWAKNTAIGTGTGALIGGVVTGVAGRSGTSSHAGPVGTSSHAAGGFNVSRGADAMMKDVPNQSRNRIISLARMAKDKTNANQARIARDRLGSYAQRFGFDADELMKHAAARVAMAEAFRRGR